MAKSKFRAYVEETMDAFATNAGSMTTKEYDEELTNIERLAELDAKVNRRPERKPIDPNQVLSIVAYLVGMGLVMNYERLHVIATKAFGLLVKPRI